MESQQRIEQIVVIALLMLLAVGCLAVLRPFLSALLWAMILSFSSWPLHAWLVRRLRGRRTLAALLMTLLVAAIFILPLAAVGTGLADSVAKVGGMVAVLLREGPPGPPAWVAGLPIVGPDLAERWLEVERLGAGWTAELKPYLDTGLNWLLSLGVRLGEAILEVSLSVLVAFFFFRDGAEGARRLDAAVKRLAGDRAQQLLAVAGGTVRSVVYGVIGTALAQAALQGFGLWLAGVPAAFFLGFLTFFLGFVPVGPPLVWLPAAAWLLYNGAFGWGLFLVGWGMFVVSGVDNVLRPYLISRGSNLPLLLMLFGVLGGLLAFGFLGVFLGPTLLAVGYVLFREWSDQPQHAGNESGAETARAPFVRSCAAEGSSAPPDTSRIDPAA
jgi:predicted PurR-regulated permease PerM